MIETNPPLSREQCFNIIYEAEVKKLLDVTIQHTALPRIEGASMDSMTQEEFNRMYPGPKPPPFSKKNKLKLYRELEDYFKPKIIEQIQILVRLSIMLSSWTDKEFRDKAIELKGRCSIEIRPVWDKIHALMDDHLLLHKEYQVETSLNRIIIPHFHDFLCPLMDKYADTKEFDDIFSKYC